MPDIKIDLDENTIKYLVSIYIKNTMSNESFELYLESPNGYMLAAVAALRNEAIITAVKEGMKYDKMSKT